MNHFIRYNFIIQNFDILQYQNNHLIKTLCIEKLHEKPHSGDEYDSVFSGLKLQYSLPYGSQCSFPHSFDFDFGCKAENCISSAKVGCSQQRWFVIAFR